jgi:hypothetical protein
MLDLDSLFAALPPPGRTVSKDQNGGGVPAPILSTGEATKPAGSLEPSGLEPDLRQPLRHEVGHSGHNGTAPIFDEVCPWESLRHKAFDGLGTVGTVGTVDFQGGEGWKVNRAPVGGAVRDEFALHPAAIILALAYCRKVKSSNDERASTIIHLESMSPGDQVRYWHAACIEAGIKPWEVLLIPAPATGLDCTRCKHLTTRQMASDGERRQFHWACALGYLILETGRATERIWIAPPECQSYERWVPSQQGDRDVDQ